jgi:hypothetical protein
MIVPVLVGRWPGMRTPSRLGYRGPFVASKYREYRCSHTLQDARQIHHQPKQRGFYPNRRRHSVSCYGVAGWRRHCARLASRVTPSHRQIIEMINSGPAKPGRVAVALAPAYAAVSRKVKGQTLRREMYWTFSAHYSKTSITFSSVATWRTLIAWWLAN